MPEKYWMEVHWPKPDGGPRPDLHLWFTDKEVRGGQPDRYQAGDKVVFYLTQKNPHPDGTPGPGAVFAVGTVTADSENIDHRLKDKHYILRKKVEPILFAQSPAWIQRVDVNRVAGWEPGYKYQQARSLSQKEYEAIAQELARRSGIGGACGAREVAALKTLKNRMAPDNAGTEKPFDESVRIRSNDTEVRQPMSNLKRDIGSEDLKITQVIELLQKDQWLIPTFQREFVWQPENIVKLWDSIYRFYPIGSLLYWETDSYLHTHRKLGGFTFLHDEDAVRKFKEWKYILDGQQRATSLLVSFLGGKGRVEGNESFDYTLYFDAAAGRFFFAGDLEERRKTTPKEFLIRLRDVPNWEFTFYKNISSVKGFDSSIEHNLQQLAKMFTDYKVSVVRIKGVEVNEVCEIFERINQEGKKLHPVDILVARTYRTEKIGAEPKGFYLRDYLQALKEPLVDQGNRFKDTDDLNVIQMLAICLRKMDTAKRSPFGITPSALDNLTADHFEKNWESFRKTFYESVKFFTDMKIHGPEMLPYVYLHIILCSYFHENKKADRRLARQWFWRTAFGVDDLRTSSEVYEFCDNFFANAEKGVPISLPPLIISKARLIQASYNYRNALSRAVLAFLASQDPRDFSDPNASVLDNVYLLLSQAPNLHHVYPLNFLKGIKGMPVGSDANSLMNICFLRARTNIQIGDRNPLTYFNEFAKTTPRLDDVLASHCIPGEFIRKPSFAPQDYVDFLKARAELLCAKLKAELPDVQVTITE